MNKWYQNNSNTLAYNQKNIFTAHLTLALITVALLFSQQSFAGGGGPDDSAPISTYNDQTCDLVSATTQSTSCGDGICNGVGVDAETSSTCPFDCLTGPAKEVAPYYHVNENWCPEVQVVTTPTTTAEVQQSVLAAKAAGKTIKMVGTRHSTTKMICSDNHMMTSEKMKTIEGIFTINDGPYTNVEVVRIQPGVTFGTDDHKVDPATGQPYLGMQNYLHQHGKAVNYASTGFAGITVGGAVATGVHGSNVTGYANISHEVQEIWIVNADGVEEYHSRGTTGISHPDKWKALTTNLGLLGPMVKLGIRVRDQFNLKANIRFHDEEEILAPGGLESVVSDCSFSFIQWFPGEGTGYLSNTCAWETTEPVDTEDTMMALFTPDMPTFMQNTFTNESQDTSCPTMGTTDYVHVRTFESVRGGWTRDAANAWIWDNTNGDNKRYTGVGYANKMYNADLPTTQIGFSQMDMEFSIHLSDAYAVLNLLNEIVEDYNVGLPTVGVVIRFDRVSDNTLLGNTSSEYPGRNVGDPLVHFEVPFFTPYKMKPGRDLDNWRRPWYDLMKRLVKDYDAIPHWGKNVDWLFADSDVHNRNAAVRARFQAIIDEMDPQGRFSNQWAAKAGFSWPNGPSYDTDEDGVSDVNEIAAGTDPQVFNGLTGILMKGDPDGSCSHVDTLDELDTMHIKSNGMRAWSHIQTQKMTSGWSFSNSAHNYTDAGFNASPNWNGSGLNNWTVHYKGSFKAESAGRYCFELNNGSTDNLIGGGRNSCSIMYLNENTLVEVGYDVQLSGGGASPKTSCLDLTAGWHDLDLVGRFHDANLDRNFKMRPKYCYGGSSNCSNFQSFGSDVLQADR